MSKLIMALSIASVMNVSGSHVVHTSDNYVLNQHDVDAKTPCPSDKDDTEKDAVHPMNPPATNDDAVQSMNPPAKNAKPDDTPTYKVGDKLDVDAAKSPCPSLTTYSVDNETPCPSLTTYSVDTKTPCPSLTTYSVDKTEAPCVPLPKPVTEVPCPTKLPCPTEYPVANTGTGTGTETGAGILPGTLPGAGPGTGPGTGTGADNSNMFEVYVEGDANYIVEGVKSKEDTCAESSGFDPDTTMCPKAGQVATSGCTKNSANWDSVSEDCVLAVDTECKALPNGSYGCAYPGVKGEANYLSDRDTENDESGAHLSETGALALVVSLGIMAFQQWIM